MFALRRPHALHLSAPRPMSLISLYDLWRSRQALRRLDAARLADAGLSRRQAHVEGTRPIWDVPAHWRR